VLVPTRKIANNQYVEKNPNEDEEEVIFIQHVPIILYYQEEGVMYVDASLEHLMVPMFGMKVVKY
jgi:hypothetical protein